MFPTLLPLRVPVLSSVSKVAGAASVAAKASASLAAIDAEIALVATPAKPQRATLPRIPAPIGHIPQRLKTAGVEPNRRARLEVLRRIVARLVREERIELPWNRALEARPYMERLLQLALERDGEEDEYAREMIEWWLPEQGLVEKMSKVLGPRLADRPTAPYTTLWKLPSKRVEGFMQNQRVFWKRCELAVLEIDGNPFPPVVPEPPSRSTSLLNVLLKGALQDSLHSFTRPCI